MSMLSKLLDRVSGRNRSSERRDDDAPTADSSSHGGTPYPNAQTTETHDPGGA